MNVNADALEVVGIIRGFMGDIQGAIKTFSRGIELFPTDARFYRHRGHRYINVRRLEDARRDFSEALKHLDQWADHIEYGRRYVLDHMEALLLRPGEPFRYPSVSQVAAAGGYYSPLPFKVYYHLALTNYLLGRFQEAKEQFERALDYAVTAELRAATVNWLVIVYHRVGEEDKASGLIDGLQLDSVPKVNAAYYDLLQVYTGKRDADELIQASSDPRIFATHGYGLGCWFLFAGQKDKAAQVFRAVVQSGDPMSFGRIAAEIELERLGG